MAEGIIGMLIGGVIGLGVGAFLVIRGFRKMDW